MNARCFTVFVSVLFFGFPPAIYTQSLTLTGLQNLNFGDTIFPGINKTVARTDGNAAKFMISGDINKEVRITFSLPTVLELTGNTMSIHFSSTDAAYNTLEFGQSTATAFDPNNAVITRLGLDGKLYIWLGGTVAPTHTQPAGTYANDIVLEVQYTCN